jgi:hypothetical protein
MSDLRERLAAIISNHRQIVDAMHGVTNAVSDCFDADRIVDAILPIIKAELAQATADALEAAAQVAVKMATAAESTLKKRHDDDAACQFDTANEIAEAIRRS